MSERPGDSVVEWLEIDLGKLSGTERVTLINEIMDLLTAQELGQVRESADKKRAGKLKEARASFISQMREGAKQLDLTFTEILEMETRPKIRTRGESGQVKVKYRSPDNQMWSGRGRVPVWLRKLEEQGRRREEFLESAT